MKNWTDTTIYKQADKQAGKETEATTWEFKASPLVSVIITRKHIHYPEHWILRCHELRIEQPIPFTQLASDDLSGAQELALRLCRTKIKNMGASFELTVLGEGCI